MSFRSLRRRSPPLPPSPSAALPPARNSARFPKLVVGHTSSGSEKLAKKVPTARVVSAFSTVPSEVLFSVFNGRRSKKRPSLVYCGDDAGAKKTAARLIRDVGFEPVDAGPLRIARYTEPFTLLMAQLAYEGTRGPAVAYRMDWRRERKA